MMKILRWVLKLFWSEEATGMNRKSLSVWGPVALKNKNLFYIFIFFELCNLKNFYIYYDVFSAFKNKDVVKKMDLLLFYVTKDAEASWKSHPAALVMCVCGEYGVNSSGWCTNLKRDPYTSITSRSPAVCLNLP